MSQEHPSQPNPDSSGAQGHPPSDELSSFNPLDSHSIESSEFASEEFASAEVTSESQELPAAPPIAADFSQTSEAPQEASPPQPPQAKSQTLQKLQQFWQTAQPKLKAGAIATYKGTIQAWALLRIGGQKFWSWWNRILPKIRRLLPASLQTQLPDAVLTGAIAAILILCLWITPSLFFSRPSTNVVTLPPSPSPTLPPSPSTPAPEQPPIAQIQDQVAEISNQYASGLIQSVQANFWASRLTVNVSDGWYGLTEMQQGKLANDILKRAQQLNFIKLELADAEGTLLARSPVVGSEMVILRTTDLQTSEDGIPG